MGVHAALVGPLDTGVPVGLQVGPAEVEHEIVPVTHGLLRGTQAMPAVHATQRSLLSHTSLVPHDIPGALPTQFVPTPARSGMSFAPLGEPQPVVKSYPPMAGNPKPNGLLFAPLVMS